MATISKNSPSSPLPPTLRTAAALLAAESLGILAIGGWLLVGTLTEDAGARPIGLSSALFVVAAGLGVGLLSYGMFRARTWTRGPVTLVQLLLLPIGWQFLPEPTTLIGIASVALAIAVLVLTFLPSSTRFLVRSGEAGNNGEGKVF